MNNEREKGSTMLSFVKIFAKKNRRWNQNNFIQKELKIDI